jgi:hypothetical protein
LGELRGKRTHQAARAVTLFEKPLAPQRSARNPIQYIFVNHRSNWFQHIKDETVTRRGIHMQHTKPGIEPESSDGESRFGFQKCVKVIEHRVDRVRRKPW